MTLHPSVLLLSSSALTPFLCFRREHQTSVLMEEVDPVATDDYQATPLVCAIYMYLIKTLRRDTHVICLGVNVSTLIILKSK